MESFCSGSGLMRNQRRVKSNWSLLSSNHKRGLKLVISQMNTSLRRQTKSSCLLLRGQSLRDDSCWRRSRSSTFRHRRGLSAVMKLAKVTTNFSVLVNQMECLVSLILTLLSLFTASKFQSRRSIASQLTLQVIGLHSHQRWRGSCSCGNGSQRPMCLSSRDTSLT